MKRNFNLALFLIILSLLGCAQLHKGSYGQVLDKSGVDKKSSHHTSNKTGLGLIISGEINIQKSSPYFAYIDFVFENTTQDWMSIEKVSIKFENDVINKNISFVSGLPLEVYMEAVKENLIIQNENQQAWNQVFAGVAMGLSSYEGRGQQTIALGNMLSLSAMQFNQEREKIQEDKIFPPGHLFYHEFLIPPGMFRKKWVVLNSKNHKDIGFVEHLDITYHLKGGKSETIRFELDKFRPWQSDEYAPKNDFYTE